MTMTMETYTSYTSYTSYTCSICYQSPCKQKILVCKHDMCEVCFKKHTNVSNVCPFCRKDLLKPNTVFNKGVKKIKTSLTNAIDSTILVKSLVNFQLKDSDREIVKELYNQLKQNMIRLNLIINDSVIDPTIYDRVEMGMDEIPDPDSYDDNEMRAFISWIQNNTHELTSLNGSSTL